MSSLREIFLSFNTLNSSIPSTLWNLKDLLIFNLSSNSFTGDLSPQVQDLKLAFLIDLSRNGFTGAIPSTSDSRKLQSLITFSLASNRLQGSIPESFGNMISLEWLDLSNNDLSGEILKTLQELTSLKHFNVSFNRLRGEIPSGGPFKNFTPQFFESNEALCGDIRLNVPPCSRKSRGKRLLTVAVVVSVAVGGSFTLAMIILMTWIIRRRQAPLYGVDNHLSDHQIPKRFSYNQIHLATDGFIEANLVGIGSSSSVYRATFEKGLVVVVKMFNLEVEHAFKSFETECHMLSSLRHRNLTRVISSCSNLDFKALLLEYMLNGSLEKWLHTDDYHLDMMQRLDIMIDVASALEYLHQGYLKSPVIHCDLKPSNILLDREMVSRVADFGITKLLVDDQSVVHTRTLATLGYMAPEYGSGGVVSSACDVYSFGIVLMETFTG